MSILTCVIFGYLTISNAKMTLSYFPDHMGIIVDAYMWEVSNTSV